MSTAAEAAAKYPPGTPVTLRCERMLHGGVCAARHPDLGIVLVEHAIPGELVEAQLRFRAKRTWFATVQRVLQPSPDRVEVPCKYVPECGGCQLQHVAYERQLELKREVLLEALRHDHVETVTTIGLHGVEDPWRYRIRGEFHVVRGGDDGGEVGLGFNRSRSWRPIAVDDCLIHDRRITEALPQLRALVQHAGTPELRTVHVTAGDDDDLLVRGMPRSALDAAALPGEGRRLSTEWTTLRWRDLLFRARSDTFIQVNWAQMDVLYARVLAALGSYTGLRVVDAYAGIGVLACALAEHAAEVVCIESNRATARAGVLNARVNEVEDRIRYVAARVEDALPEVAARGRVDALIVDPPRAGCDRRVTAWLALAGPPRVVYVSCDPATLARDLRVLVASGPYTIDAMDIVDMFPQTYHVETVVALGRADQT